MAAKKKATAKPTKTFEQTLWDAADNLLTRYDYPLDKEERAFDLVLEQAELVAIDGAA